MRGGDKSKMKLARETTTTNEQTKRRNEMADVKDTTTMTKDVPADAPVTTPAKAPAKAAVKAKPAKKATKAPAKAATKAATTKKKKVGGTIKWQEHLSPLRKFTNTVLVMFDLPKEYHPNRNEMAILKKRVKSIVADLKVNEITIPRRLKGKLDEVLAK